MLKRAVFSDVLCKTFHTLYRLQGIFRGRLTQRLECHVYTVEVTSSNLVSPTLGLEIVTEIELDVSSTVLRADLISQYTRFDSLASNFR